MRWLAERGIACHSLDFRGHGRATGRRGFVRRWEEYLEDLDAFLSLEQLAVKARGEAPLFLLGHSHGGLVLAAAGIRGLEDVSGCVFTAPYFRSRLHVPAHKIFLGKLIDPLVPWLRIPAGLLDEWMTSDPGMREDSRLDTRLNRTATPRWYNGCQRAQLEILARAPVFRHPLLMLVAEADPVADPAGARDFFGQVGSTDRTLHSYPQFLHEILREADRESVFSDIHSWIAQRLPGIQTASS